MDQKEVDLNEEQELSPEELAEFMASYKKELARIYKMSSAKKSFMVRQKLPNLKMALEECDRDMRKDIDELKRSMGSTTERQLLFFQKTLFYLLQKMKLHDILLTSLETRPLETKTNQGFEKRA